MPLAAARHWLRAVVSYDPRAGCWAIYWPDRHHRSLIEGPLNPLLPDPSTDRQARLWAKAHLDSEAAFAAACAARAGSDTSTAGWVTEWKAIELLAKVCWVPLFTTTPSCALPFEAGHDSTGSHGPCQPYRPAPGCRPDRHADLRA